MMSLTTKRFIFFSLVTVYILYTAFVYTAGTVTTNPISEEASEGRQLFRDKNCIACHQLYGLGGYMGPDLTNVISLRGDEYVRTYVSNGTAKMPDFNLSGSEVNKLIAYLSYVDETSHYPVCDFDVTWYGTICKKENSK